MRILIFISLFLFTGFSSAQDSDYQLVWSDEFEGENVDTQKWNFEIGGNGWGNQELQYYTNRPENIFIRDQKLVIKALYEEYGTRNFTSARISTQNKMSVKYGKIEARIKLPKGKGTWPAFWMMPQNSTYGGWPRSGEIDIMEHVGSNPNMISYALHTQSKNGNLGNNWHNQIYPGDVEGVFHTYSIEWLEDRIAFYFDDQKQVTYWNDLANDYKTWPFDQDFYVILNLAIGGNMGGTVDVDIFNEDVEMEVEYVHVYQKNGSSIDDNKHNPVQVSANRLTRNIEIKGLFSKANISITDLKGVEHLNLNVSESDLQIDSSTFGTGVFFVAVSQSGSTDVYKVIL